MNISIVLLIIVLISITVNAGSFYTSANKNTYYIEPAYNYKWFEAHIECHNRNMTLFTIDDEDKFYDLYNILISGKFTNKPPHFWIGGIGANRKFTWIPSGKPVVWKYGSPDNSGNQEHCLHIYQNSKEINDNKCDTKFGFACQDNTFQCSNNYNYPRTYEEKYKSITLNINQKSKN